jgi:hypothetical protein
VQAVATAQHRWQQFEQRIEVASDLEALFALLARADAQTVLDLTVSGTVDLAGRQRLQAALGEAEARVRCLRTDLGALRLDPTAADIAALQVDGYLGELVAELRETEGDDAQRAQDALAILTGLLAERRPPQVSA